MEVAVGGDLAVAEQDRVVDGGGQLTAGDGGGVGGGVAGGPVDGGGAAQRVGVLHPVAVGGAVAGHHAAAGQQRPQVGGGRGLAGVGPQLLKGVGEDVVGTEQRLHAHRGGDVGGAQQVVEVGQRHHEHAEHPVGAVDQRQPLLLLQHQRGDAGSGQHRSGRDRAPFGPQHLPLPHRHQRAVRQRGEVAGAAEAAVLVDRRGDAGVEQRGVGLRDHGTHAGVAARHRPQAQQHHGADDLGLDQRAGAGGVGADQRLLQLGAPVAGDLQGGQRPEAGGDAVDGLVAGGQGADHLAGGGHGVVGLGVDGDGGVVAGDGEDVGGGQRGGADGDLGGHGRSVGDARCVPVGAGRMLSEISD